MGEGGSASSWSCGTDQQDGKVYECPEDEGGGLRFAEQHTIRLDMSLEPIIL